MYLSLLSFGKLFSLLSCGTTYMLVMTPHIPILDYRGHWNLLVLCNFGKTNYLGTEKGPRMLLLDSLKTTKLARLRTAINTYDPFIFLPVFASKIIINMVIISWVITC